MNTQIEVTYTGGRYLEMGIRDGAEYHGFHARELSRTEYIVLDRISDERLRMTVVIGKTKKEVFGINKFTYFNGNDVTVYGPNTIPDGETVTLGRN